ncbi:endonuclease/exonuclease/phosphatase family protein [Formosa algae]|uniref:endonuclease/exonuclease/phosphatase family protein n=1 Tax=Formosa algae TaxID=225843 RepID=UPI000CD23F9F|nr:endonuclease/exonuclease/phosphatase family protein [Formosa algae]
MPKIYFYFIIVFLLAITASCTSNSKRAAILAKQQNSEKLNTTSSDTTTNKKTKKSTKKSESLKITTWNIRDLGKTKNANEILEIAKILRDYDIVAIQEVVAKDPAGAQAVAKIVDELNRMGSKWNYRISNPTKSPSVYISERYAFLWKTSKVKLTSRAYLDSDLEDKLFREPFIGKFQSTKGSEPFYVVNFHSRKFNDHPEQEIIYLKEYTTRLNSDYILIAGDFNLDEKHVVWDNLYNIGFKSALHNTKTTLKTKCKNGSYLNYPIDNIFYSKNIFSIKSQAIDFVSHCNRLEIARQLSDHLPVYMEFQIK